MTSYPLDPTIADIADRAAAHPIPLAVATGVLGTHFALCCWLASREVAAAAAQAFAAGFAAAGQLAAQPTEASTRGARHLAYSEGVRRPARRETAEDRRARERAAWGYGRQAVAS